MVSSFVLPTGLATCFDPHLSYKLWSLQWAQAPPWRPLGYIWWMHGHQKWGTTLQGDGGYFIVRVEETNREIAIVFVEGRVMLRFELISTLGLESARWREKNITKDSF